MKRASLIKLSSSKEDEDDDDVHQPKNPSTSKPDKKPETTTPSKKPSRRATTTIPTTEWNDDDDELERKYDLSPVERMKAYNKRGYSSEPFLYVDPWEVDAADQERIEAEQAAAAQPRSPTERTQDEIPNITQVMSEEEEHSLYEEEKKSVFILPGDIHPNMEHKEDDIDQLRLLAGKLSADWRAHDFMAPALARRIRDFQFAQEKRRKKYGDERPWGILGLYDHLSSIRTDVNWAEDAARRRANGESYQSWADYDESKKSGYNRPFFTYFLLVVCSIVLVASIAVNGWKVEPLNENPMIGPSAETLIKMGAKDTYLIVVQNEGWRLLTSTVLHAGLVHYFINMLALWFVGGAIETSHGWVAAMIIFGISAVGGTILSAIFLPEYITVGASGGIFGFIGACLADIIMNWKLLFNDFVNENGKKQSHIMVVVILILDIALNCVIGLTPYVDNFTHLGGMLYGFLCGLSTMQRLSTDFFGMEESCFSRAKHFFVRFFGIILSIVAIVITLVVLFHGDGETTPCPGCTWLSCVPFPPWEGERDKWWYCDDCGRVTADIVTEPNLHLDLYCPNGETAKVDLTNATDVSRDYLQKQLPTYCREYCWETTNSSSVRF